MVFSAFAREATFPLVAQLAGVIVRKSDTFSKVESK